MEKAFDMQKNAFVDFQGKKVLVSGASSGFGRAVCIELSKRGACVILLGRNEEKLQVTANSLETEDFHIRSLS